MTRKNIFAVTLFLLLATNVNGFKETVYVQPYLGVLPEWLRERFSAEALKQQTENNLASVVRESDLIVVAVSKYIREVPANTGRFTNYETAVEIIETIKGKEQSKNLRLIFSAFTTGIEKNAKHLFFLKRTSTNYSVLRSAYIYPRGIGFDNRMMMFQSVVGSEDIGLAAVRYLTNKSTGVNVESLLKRDFESDKSDKNYSAVKLAAAIAPHFGIPILKMAVSKNDRKGSDTNLYATAAYCLASQRQPLYWQMILNDIPVDHGRLEESIAFDLVSKLGTESTVDVIKTLVSRRPEFVVSAAFGLSGIGGQKARSVIVEWLNDPVISGRKERIFNGWTEEFPSVSTLLKDALSKTSAVSRK